MPARATGGTIPGPETGSGGEREGEGQIDGTCEEVVV